MLDLMLQSAANSRHHRRPQEKQQREHTGGLAGDELQAGVAVLRGVERAPDFSCGPFPTIKALNAKNKMQRITKELIILKHSYQNTKN